MVAHNGYKLSPQFAAILLCVIALLIAACSTTIPLQGSEEAKKTSASCENEAFFVPNAITPNGDGVNDTWRIRYKSEVDSLQVRLYNRYGELIFASASKDFDWDATDTKGRRVKSDVYVFALDYYWYNTLHQCKGSLTVIY